MGVDAAHRAAARAHDEALRRDAAGVEADAVEQRAVGDAGGGEEAVVAANEVVGGEHGAEVETGASIAGRSSSSAGHSRPWISPPMHFRAAAEMTPSGVPPTPISTSTPLPADPAAIAP